MKKITLITLAAIAAAFNFSSCQKNEVPAPEQEVKGNFSIIANITKTTIDGYATAWAEGDAISVFHIGDTDWSAKDWTKFTNAGQFTLADVATGKFLGTATPGEGAHRFYAFYPYSDKMTTPDNSTCYTNIGSSGSKTAQKQAGNNSTAHLAGQYFPLVAQSSEAWTSGSVSLNFKPILSIVKFHVTNKTTEPLTVSTIKITAEEEQIAGSYYINFCEDAPVFTPSGDKYVSNTAQLSVTNGTEIAADESADFYLAIKPFTNVDGKSITFIVNGCEKSITTAQAFKGGEVKTINFNYDKQPKVLEDGAYVALVQNSGTSYFAMTSTDDGASTKRFKSANVTYDGTKTFKTADASIVWNVTKSDGSYLFENGGKYISWSSGNSAILSTDPYKLDLIENEDYYNIKSHADASRTLSKNSTSAFFAFYGTLSQKYNFILVPAELSADPVINPITAPAKVEAEGATGVEVSYTISNPVAGKSVSAVSAESWVNNFNYDTAGKIIFDVDANSAEEERSSEITVSYEGAEDVKFTVTQAGSASSTVYTWTLASGQITITAGTYKSGEATWAFTLATYIGFDGSKGVQIGSSKNPTKSYNISTEYFATKTIKSITVNSSVGSNGTAKLSIAVGGTDVLTDQSLTTSAKDYKVESINKGGKVEIKFSNTEKAMYLKSISVEYN